MFDNRLKKLRMAKNLTQEEVAKALGLPKTTYCNYERDEREPSAMTLLKISAYFGVSSIIFVETRAKKIPRHRKATRKPRLSTH